MLRAIYPGSFDPITNGHIYIAERASAIADELVVAVLDNSQKSPLFSVEERVSMTRESLRHLPNVEIGSFAGLLIDYTRKISSRLIIRGLRALSDFEFEFQMAQMNRKLAPEIETIFVVTDAKYSYISSRTIKEIFRLGGCVKGLVPQCVLSKLKERFNQIGDNESGR